MGNKSFYSNEQIIDGIVSNNTSIMDFIYQEYFPVVENIIRNKFYGSKEDAKDIFQDALIVLYRGACSSPPLKIKYSFFTFFATICKRKMIDQIRKNEKFVHYENEDDLPTESEKEILELIHKAEKIKLYKKYFFELGEKCQELIRLFLEDYSIAEITNMLKMSSENFTKKRRTQCKDSLFIKIYEDPQFKELINGKPWTIREIPRW